MFAKGPPSGGAKRATSAAAAEGAYRSAVERLLRDPDQVVRVRAVEAILRRRDRWGVLLWALRLRRDPEPAVARDVERVLSGWRGLPRELYVRPTASQRAELVSMLGTLDDEPAVRETVGRVLGR